jgi:hypothetical protein
VALVDVVRILELVGLSLAAKLKQYVFPYEYYLPCLVQPKLEMKKLLLWDFFTLHDTTC